MDSSSNVADVINSASSWETRGLRLEEMSKIDICKENEMIWKHTVMLPHGNTWMNAKDQCDTIGGSMPEWKNGEPDMKLVHDFRFLLQNNLSECLHEILGYTVPEIY